ncbi:MAG: methyltransferase, TrmA family [Bacteroidetes bacterium]|jgi:23S rRNA (uracil1939-C5)-methyltransferase|nr:methyltransferase, TrmA family [Bacteroidota bacterium]MDF2452561.1 methyltransferase, TrmA family [Bacteroidota bacterium]
MSKIKKNIFVENAEIVDISSEGKSVAKVDGMVIFVDGGVPGDIADVMITRKKNNYAEGHVVTLKTPSPKRVTPICEHFGNCGGCKWQHMDYQTQLFFKEKTVSDALTRIGKLNVSTMKPIFGNKESYFYRNKLEFSFSDKKWLTSEEIKSGLEIDNRNALGFHIPKMFDKILDIKNCYLQEEPSNSIRNEIRDFANKNGLTFFGVRDKAGLMRTLMIRSSSNGELMVLIQFFENQPENIDLLLNHLKNTFPKITSLQYVINQKGNDTLQDLEIKTFYGRDHIFEEMEGLKFKISAKSFYQTNSPQAFELYKITRDLCGLTGHETVYDLYTGTGTIANFVAKKAGKVIGVEYVEDAVVDAKANSDFNGINNTSFYAGDMKDVLNDAFIASHGKPDVIITDPPRAGMHEDVVRVILRAAPPKIVYVSCNPATQARDLAMMMEDYEIREIQPVDMFPQTAHVENVVLLVRK